MDYKRILEKFKDKHVLIIGDIILDHFIWGNVDRISPEAPVPVVDVKRESYLLGGAGNVANNITSLNSQASIVGVVGNDHWASILNGIFHEKKIKIDGIFPDTRPTTIKTRVIAHNQQVVRFDREKRDSISSTAFKSITNYISDNIENFDAVIISDYKKGLVTTKLIDFLLKMAKPKDIFIAVDPKVGHFHYYKGVSIITPNKKEASESTGIAIKDNESLEKAGLKLFHKLSCDGVLITRGDEGMSLFTKDDIHHIPTVAQEVYDVTGAGDTVISVFTLAYTSEASMLQSAVIANYAAGIVVGELGTATTNQDKLLNSLINSKT